MLVNLFQHLYEVFVLTKIVYNGLDIAFHLSVLVKNFSETIRTVAIFSFNSIYYSNVYILHRLQ